MKKTKIFPGFLAVLLPLLIFGCTDEDPGFDVYSIPAESLHLEVDTSNIRDAVDNYNRASYLFDITCTLDFVPEGCDTGRIGFVVLYSDGTNTIAVEQYAPSYVYQSWYGKNTCMITKEYVENSSSKKINLWIQVYKVDDDPSPSFGRISSRYVTVDFSGISTETSE